MNNVTCLHYAALQQDLLNRLGLELLSLHLLLVNLLLTLAAPGPVAGAGQQSGRLWAGKSAAPQ